MTLITKIRQYHANYPEVCVDIVVHLTGQLSDEKVLKDVLAYLAGLVGGEHNAKRKIVYVRMLAGLASSLKRQPDRQTKSLLAQ